MNVSMAHSTDSEVTCPGVTRTLTKYETVTEAVGGRLTPPLGRCPLCGLAPVGQSETQYKKILSV